MDRLTIKRFGSGGGCRLVRALTVDKARSTSLTAGLLLRAILGTGSTLRRVRPGRMLRRLEAISHRLRRTELWTRGARTGCRGCIWTFPILLRPRQLGLRTLSIPTSPALLKCRLLSLPWLHRFRWWGGILSRPGWVCPDTDCQPSLVVWRNLVLVLAPLLHVVAISSSNPVGAVDFFAKRAFSGEVTGSIL